MALCSSLCALAADVIEVKVKALDGFGGDTGSVISRCQTKVGAPYDPVTVTRDVNALKDSNEFEEISVDAQRLADGVGVTFYVKRKLRFQAPIVVQGSDFFSESKISKESGLRDGYQYGESDLAEAAAKIRLVYQKKYFLDAKVTPVVDLIPGGNNCTVTFVIVEGARQKIRAFAFTGVQNVKESELREAIGDLPWWNPLGWFGQTPVTDEQQMQCIAKIEEVYRNYGYLDVAVATPERQPLPDGKVDVAFAVTEGPRYRIGEIAITGVTRYPVESVRTKSELPAPGTVAGEKTLADAARRIQIAVGSGNEGLADSHVEVKRVPAADDPSKLDIVFAVHEGVPVVINDIRIRGNDYTKDKVIRREIRLGPGDRMLEDQADKSQKRLESLDYFSRVRYSLEATDKGKDASGAEYRDLVYEVEEKNTGSFMVGLGASSVDSVYLTAEVSQSNFDLFAPSKFFRGGGQKGRLYAAVGPRIQTYEASVTEPYFLDRFLELSVEAYRRQRWYDEYDIIRSGGGASLSYPVKFGRWINKGEPFGRFGVRLSAEMIEFDEVDEGQYTLDGVTRRWLKEEERKYGDAAEGVLRVFWNLDRRDNFRLPSRGSRTQLFADLGTGDNEYWRIGFLHRHYFTTWEKYRHVLMVGVRGETIDAFSSSDSAGGLPRVPIYNRMFLGGPKSIRGVKYRNVSPAIQKAGGGDWVPWGGQTLFCANFEYTVPIVKMLRVAAFSDLGSVGAEDFDLDFSDTFAWTVGLGIRLDIQMFPIRLDFGTPIEKPDHAEKEVFSFTVGYDF